MNKYICSLMNVQAWYCNYYLIIRCLVLVALQSQNPHKNKILASWNVDVDKNVMTEINAWSSVALFPGLFIFHAVQQLETPY